MKAHFLIQALWLAACGSTSASDFEFVAIGDTRPRFESESFQPFQHLIAKINASKPALVINLGDLIYGYGVPGKEKQWDKYQTVVKEIASPYYQIPGNHDTHSKAARRVYGRRFGKFYQSFDYADCHFVLLDSTEDQRWGRIGPAQLEWLRRDLASTRAKMVFVFTHFPTWEPDRIIPEYHEFWDATLHPLFKASRVRAVFGGHYHTYGPTRERDGVRYFITGGGGAELIPEYRKSGGQYHFMKVKVSGDQFDVRIVTEGGEMSDSEADIMGGLQFAARNVSRIGVKGGPEDLKAGVTFEVSVANPYSEDLTGEARWVLDTSSFSVEPPQVALNVPVGDTRSYSFKLKALQDRVTLQSLPRLEFRTVSENKIHRFHREVRFFREMRTPYRESGPVLDGQYDDWFGIPRLNLGGGSQPQAELASCHDPQNLYLALSIPAPDTEEGKELGFSDEVQIGLAQRRSETDFGNDFLRLGVNCGSHEVRDRTPGRKAESVVRGVKSACRTEGRQKRYEVAIPLQLLKHPKAGASLLMDVSFPLPRGGPETGEPAEPKANTVSYRIRYGSDSLVPVYFVELNLEHKK